MHSSQAVHRAFVPPGAVSVHLRPVGIVGWPVRANATSARQPQHVSRTTYQRGKPGCHRRIACRERVGSVLRDLHRRGQPGLDGHASYDSNIGVIRQMFPRKLPSRICTSDPA
jgi:hypothetical protein